MAFIVTALYALALFSVGLFFIRRGKKEKQKSEDHCGMPTRNGPERRTGQDRRSGIDRRNQEVALTH